MKKILGIAVAIIVAFLLALFLLGLTKFVLSAVIWIALLGIPILWFVRKR